MYELDRNSKNPFEQKFILDPGTDIMGQFLGPETYIMGNRYNIHAWQVES